MTLALPINTLNTKCRGKLVRQKLGLHTRVTAQALKDLLGFCDPLANQINYIVFMSPMDRAYNMIFAERRGKCGLPKMHDYVYFWFDCLFTVSVAGLAFLCTDQNSQLFWVFTWLIVAHCVIILLTDYGPGSPKDWGKAIPLWLMYLFDWGIVFIFALGPYLFDGSNSLGDTIYGILTGVGVIGLFFLEPFPQAEEAVDSPTNPDISVLV